MKNNAISLASLPSVEVDKRLFNDDVPVGLYFISPLNRPISSSSVQGSLRIWCASSLLGDDAPGVGVLG